MLAVLFMGVTALPAIAAPTLAALGARDEALPAEKQEMEEVLKTSPTGNHYAGIEYAAESRGETPLNDAAIKDRIESTVKENLIVSVSNGSVRLDGTVSDKGSAQNIVERIKNIPGVHEVSFDLGLKS
jgi:translation initiation factor 2 alpha subunit (eIF-2alpha)